MQDLKRGSLVWADFEEAVDKRSSVQHGVRPAVVLSGDTALKFSPVIFLAPITSRQKKPLPIHVSISSKSCSIKKDSTILLEQIRVVDKRNILSYIGETDNETLGLIKEIIKFQFIND